jgi:hypothetical protein
MQSGTAIDLVLLLDMASRKTILAGWFAITPIQPIAGSNWRKGCRANNAPVAVGTTEWRTNPATPIISSRALAV